MANLSFLLKRTILSDVLQGIIAGGVLAFITAQILMNAQVTTINGWTTIFGCGEPGNGILLQAACANKLPAVNVPQEAMHWTTSVDSAGHSLSGPHDYTMRFPAGGLPPNNSLLVIGRVLVYSDSDVSTAYGLAKQMQLAPLSQN